MNRVQNLCDAIDIQQSVDTLRAISKVYNDTTVGLKSILESVKMLISSLETSDLIKATEINDALLVRKFKSLDEHYRLLMTQLNNETKALFLTPVGSRFLRLFALRFANTIHIPDTASQIEKSPFVQNLPIINNDNVDNDREKETLVESKSKNDIQTNQKDDERTMRQSDISVPLKYDSSMNIIEDELENIEETQGIPSDSRPIAIRMKNDNTKHKSSLTAAQKRLNRLREAKAFSFGSMSRRYL